MSCGYLSQLKYIYSNMSGIKLFRGIYYFRCCMFCLIKINLKFLIKFDMIWCVQKWYFLEELIRIEIWIYSDKDLTQGLVFQHIFYQTSLFDKIVYQNWSILLDSLLNMCICVHNIPYAICLCVPTTYSILYVNASYQTTLVLITRNQCTTIS